MPWMAALLMLTACDTAPAPQIVASPEPMPAVASSKPKPTRLPVPPVPPVPAAEPVAPVVPSPDEVMRLPARELPAAADRARADATGYVAWSQSRPENIQALTVLTTRLNTATTEAETREALTALRGFLATKGD